MTIIKETVSGNYSVKLTDLEVDERRRKLVTLHVQLQDLVAAEDAAKRALKNAKENTEAHRNSMEELASVCRTGTELQFLDDAPVEVDTTTWLRTLFHPEDHRVVSQRQLSASEREQYRQTEILTPDELDAEEAARGRKKRKAPGSNGAAAAQEGGAE